MKQFVQLMPYNKTIFSPPLIFNNAGESNDDFPVSLLSGRLLF